MALLLLGPRIFAVVTLIAALFIDEAAQTDVWESLSTLLYNLVGMAWQYGTHN